MNWFRSQCRRAGCELTLSSAVVDSLRREGELSVFSLRDRRPHVKGYVQAACTGGPELCVPEGREGLSREQDIGEGRLGKAGVSSGRPM